MSDSAKMTTLDFVISALKEHEKMLDAATRKLEKVFKTISATAEKSEARANAQLKGSLKILCENWDEFKKVGIGATAVTFHINGRELKIQTVRRGMVFEYMVQIPWRFKGVKDGLQYEVEHLLEPAEIREFLSRELRVPAERVIRGEIQFSQ
ncbi:MAG: hypothetical protein NZ952_06745 [Candidatus Bathyarchaeota archaeon]|nr:hypothetical protein [Candidatus Bathyarchaeota archaeon]